MTLNSSLVQLSQPLVTGESRINGEHRIRRTAGLPHWTLHYTIGGSAWFNPPDGDRFETNPCDAVMIAPNIPHAYGAMPKTGWHTWWFVFDKSEGVNRWLNSWCSRGRGYHAIGLSDQLPAQREKIEKLMRECLDTVEGPDPNNRWLALNSLERALIWIDGTSSRRANTVDERLEKALSYISASLGKSISLQDMARAAGISAPQLNRLFRRHLGSSPGQYVDNARMSRAKELLEASFLSIKTISWEVGFNSQFYFSSRFRKAFGQSPSEYRRNLKLATIEVASGSAS